LGVATIIIGNTAIDYAAELVSQPNLAPAVGETFDVMGIQPVSQGRVLVGLQHRDTAVVWESLGFSADSLFEDDLSTAGNTRELRY
jgi:hypothetical protein